MDVYLLDRQTFRRSLLVDDFESMIWTERFADVGDFQLVIASTERTRSIFSVGTMLQIQKSNRVMTTTRIVDQYDDNDNRMLTVIGKSLESILQSRVARLTMLGSEAESKWTLSGTPKGIAEAIFVHICVNGALGLGDRIPYYYPGNFYPEDTLPYINSTITTDITSTTVFDAIKSLCDSYGMGFRLVRRGDADEVYFNIYTGRDRTIAQSSLPIVVFSPDLDNLSRVSRVDSNDNHKNVAIVTGKDISITVYGPDARADVMGFNRKVIHLTASDVVGTDEAAIEALKQYGLSELANHTIIKAFDGEISQDSAYQYGVDYDLGDMIELRTDYGETNNMRVTEQTFVHDAQGERSYPTLVIDVIVTPGSWGSWDALDSWAGADGTWADHE